MRTQVGIVGAGPAGLLLSLMLQRRGVGCVVVESRTRETIEAAVRAGILEQSTVDLMQDLGVADRLRREAVIHEGTILRFGGRNQRRRSCALRTSPQSDATFARNGLGKSKPCTPIG